MVPHGIHRWLGTILSITCCSPSPGQTPRCLFRNIPSFIPSQPVHLDAGMGWNVVGYCCRSRSYPYSCSCRCCCWIPPNDPRMVHGFLVSESRCEFERQTNDGVLIAMLNSRHQNPVGVIGRLHDSTHGGRGRGRTSSLCSPASPRPGTAALPSNLLYRAVSIRVRAQTGHTRTGKPPRRKLEVCTLHTCRYTPGTSRAGRPASGQSKLFFTLS